MNGVGAVGCLSAGEALNSSQTAIGTVLAGVTGTMGATSTTSTISSASAGG